MSFPRATLRASWWRRLCAWLTRRPIARHDRELPWEAELRRIMAEKNIPPERYDSVLAHLRKAMEMKKRFEELLLEERSRQ